MKRPVEQIIVDTIIKRARPKRILLFGSRARDDAHERSDYDIAIDDEQLTPALLARIRADIEEIPTLHQIDVLWVNNTTGAFRQRILSEGRVLYERPS
jgi:predicted nucleotidyltransferase